MAALAIPDATTGGLVPARPDAGSEQRQSPRLPASDGQYEPSIARKATQPAGEQMHLIAEAADRLLGAVAPRRGGLRCRFDDPNRGRTVGDDRDSAARPARPRRPRDECHVVRPAPLQRELRRAFPRLPGLYRFHRPQGRPGDVRQTRADLPRRCRHGTGLEQDPASWAALSC